MVNTRDSKTTHLKCILVNLASRNNRALTIAVDLNAIRHNLNIAKQASANQKIFAVVKADAYGHGAVRVAQALEAADGFAVVTLNEAIELREAFITQPILVLQSAQCQSEASAFVQYNLWPVIHCEEQLNWFGNLEDAAQLKCWLKIDTGMGRLGFSPDRAQTILNEQAKLNWFGMLTHFASADQLDKQTTAEQIIRFNAIEAPKAIQKSMANSAAVLAWAEANADWARPGIMLYGSNPIVDDHGKTLGAQLMPAMRVTTPLISIKSFPAGANIGYGGTYQCAETMTIGYAAIGYGDGIPRVLDESATVLVAGQECPVVGRVSMDSIAIDLREVTKAYVGMEVVLWGPEHSVEIFAKAADTISYELYTSIKGVREYVSSVE